MKRGADYECSVNVDMSKLFYQIYQQFPASLFIQHIVLAIKASVAFLIPDVPKWVILQIARQEYAAKCALRKQVSDVLCSVTVLLYFVPSMIKSTPTFFSLGS